MARIKPEQKVPKSKTFTGCWTCRKRSVKCDTTRPVCLRCQRSKRDCEGYGLNLHWVDRGRSTAPNDIKRSVQSLLHLPQWTYTMDQVEGFLEDVDQTAIQSGTHPFIAFKISSGLDSTGDLDDYLTGQSSFALSEVESPSTQTSTLSEVFLREHSQDFSSGTVHKSKGNMRSLCPDIAGYSDRPPFSKTYDYNSPTTIMSNVLVCQQALTGHLLQNYIDNVTNLLQPIPQLTNYYSAMYIPNAVAGSFGIDQDFARTQDAFSNIAIFYSVLATSAFHLSGVDESGQLNTIGRNFKCQAFNYLRKGIEKAQSCFEGREIPSTKVVLDRYRDAMAAMLTLVTADIMEGRMNEYSIHLDGIDDLNQTWRSKKTRFIFTKQQITIGSFLRILSATTLSDPPLRAWSAADDTLFEDSAIELFPDQCALEHVYGITPSLAVHMAQITAISQTMSGFVLANKTFPKNLQNLYTRLHRALYSWSLDGEKMPSLENASSLVKQVGLLHFSAFASAIKVHFHTRVIPCDDNELAKQVGLVVDYLNKIERIKTDSNNQLGDIDRKWASVTWPGFISSCEARPNARRSWYKWWQSMLRYRIGNIAHLWQVVQASWAFRDAGGSEVPAWAPVLRQSGRRILAV